MNLQKSMELSLKFGLTGAVAVPFVYEAYANISRTFALTVFALWVIFAGVKFSFLKFKEAFLGITCTMAYSGVFGMICYCFVHPRVKEMLTKRSVYFMLEAKEQLKFVLYIFLILLCMYLIWAMRFAVRKTAEKLRDNAEKAGEYIDNAFDDSEEDKS